MNNTWSFHSEEKKGWRDIMNKGSEAGTHRVCTGINKGCDDWNTGKYRETLKEKTRKVG